MNVRLGQGVSWPAMRIPTGRVMFLVLIVGFSDALLGCGDSESEEQRRGVGSACTVNTDCTETTAP